MKFIERNIWIVVFVGAAIFITACSKADQKLVTPEPASTGESLMRSMSDTLAKSKAFTFETSERIEAIAPDGEKRSLNFSRKVTVRRPNGLYFELKNVGETPFEIAAFYDGTTVTLNDKPNGPSAQIAVPGTLDEMLDDVAKRFGFPVPFGDVVYSSPYDALIGKHTRGGIAAREVVDGVACFRLEYSDEFVGVTLWLPVSGPALPHRLELSYKRSAVPLVTQINFTNWKLDAAINDAMFAFQAPAGQATVGFGKFVDGVTSRSIPAAPKAPASGNPEVKPADSPKAK